MFGMGIQMLVAGTWYIAMLFLIFCVWKRVRHWSGILLLCSVALMLVLRMVEMAQGIPLVLKPQVLRLPPQGNYDFMLVVTPSTGVGYFGWLLAYAGGGIAGIGALLALRKRKWRVQVWNEVG